MLYSSLKATVLPLMAAGAAAKTIRVDVGRSGLTYTPDSVTADVGDIVEYHFSQTQHSVVAADFNTPCSPLGNGGFFSGIIQTTTDSPVFQVTISSTNPIFFYCVVDQHCQNGMVGVINPSSSQTLEQFRNAAAGASSGPTPNAPYGGQLISAVSSSTTSTAPPASSSTHTSGTQTSSSETSTVTHTTGTQTTGTQTVVTPTNVTQTNVTQTSVTQTNVTQATQTGTATGVVTASILTQTTATEATATQATATQTTTPGVAQPTVGRPTTTTTPPPGVPTAAARGLTAPLGALAGIVAGVAAFVV